MNPSEIKQGLQEHLDTIYNVDLSSIYETEMMVQNIASIVFGTIANLLIIFMGLVTALDIAYITLPLFREVVARTKWDGSKHKYLRLVSKDAISAIEQANTIETGRGILGIYLLKRLKTYLICAFVLTILIGGSGILKNLVSKIVISIIQSF